MNEILASLRYITCLLALGIALSAIFLMDGCSTKPAPIPANRQWELYVFSQTLPVDQPDRCLATIRDSARNQWELMILCETLMYKAEIVESPEAYFRLLEGIKKSVKHIDESFQAKMDMHKGYKYYTTGRYDSALYYFHKSLPVYEKTGDVPHISEILRLFARTYSDNENLVAAHDYAIQNLELLQKYPQPDWHDKYYALSVLGDCYLKGRHYQKAKETYELALAESINKENGDYYSAAEWEGLSDVYAELRQPDSAMLAAQNGEALILKAGATDLIPGSFLRLGVAYRLKQNDAAAIEYLKTALANFDSLKYNILAVVASAQIGYTYQAGGDFSRAENWYAQTLDRLQKANKPVLKSAVLDSLAVIRFRRSEIREGLKLSAEAKLISDSLFNIENQQIIENLNLKYETAQRDQQIKDLRFQQESTRMQALIFTLLFILALSAIFVLILLIRQRQTAQIQESTLAAAREQQFRIEIAGAAFKLEKFEQNMLAKNQLIVELENRFNLLTQTAHENQADYEAHKAELSKARILTDNDWKEYLHYFEQVHAGLIDRLKTSFDHLTKGDLRFFILMRQGFDMKETEQILGISTLGVKKARYRLRKKMSLSEEENLEEAVKNF